MKEYFTSTYEQKRKEKLLELNNTYNELLNTYNSQSDSNIIKKQEAANALYSYDNTTIMTELDNYLDLIDSQMTILENKKKELDTIENDIISLKKQTSKLDYSTNLNELETRNKSSKMINIFLLIICILLVILFFFFSLITVKN